MARHAPRSQSQSVSAVGDQLAPTSRLPRPTGKGGGAHVNAMIDGVLRTDGPLAGWEMGSEADDAAEGHEPAGIDDAVEVVDDVPVDTEGDEREHAGVAYGDDSGSAGDR